VAEKKTCARQQGQACCNAKTQGERVTQVEAREVSQGPRRGARRR
jgi:hypothetical protein